MGCVEESEVMMGKKDAFFFRNGALTTLFQGVVLISYTLSIAHKNRRVYFIISK